MKHDSFFSKVVFEKCIQKVIAQGVSVLHIFSDGCSSQYKSRYTFKHLSGLQAKYPSVRLTRHFFGAGHGKSLCDSSGGVVKNAASRAVVSGVRIIQSAQDMFSFCTEKMITSTSCPHVSSERSFQLLSSDDIARGPHDALGAVKGTQSIHSLLFDNGKTRARDMSCFCNTCLLGESGVCCNRNFVSDWKVVSVHNVKNGPTSSGIKQKSKKRELTAPKSNPLSNLCISSSQPASKVPCLSGDDDTVHAISDSNLSSESRLSYFTSFQAKLVECVTFSELKSVVESEASNLSKFCLSAVGPRRLIDVGIVDKVALRLMPSFLNPLFPVLTVADGNCAACALSLACFGDQEHHIEVRCRLVVELVFNSLDYLCLESEDLYLIHLFSDSYTLDLTDTFHTEVLKVSNSGEYMGMWQLMAAANVFGCQIFSVYPDKADAIYKKFYTRTLNPRVARSDHTVVLFWSATEEHDERMPEDNWTAYHIVPLLGLTQFVTVADVEN